MHAGPEPSHPPTGFHQSGDLTSKLLPLQSTVEWAWPPPFVNWADIEVAWDAEELNLVFGLFLTENHLEQIKVQLFQHLSRLRKFGHHLEGSQARDPVVTCTCCTLGEAGESYFAPTITH